MDLKRTALLVIDMQEYFRSIGAGIVDNVNRLIDLCHTGGAAVIYTRHGIENPEKDGGMLLEWWGEVIRPGEPDHGLLPELREIPDGAVLDKTRYSAFKNTDLDETLRSRGIETVLITGVMTNLCCETTARDAFMLDYRIIFVSDANATILDEYHEATLLNLRYGFALIRTTDEIFDACSRSSE